MSEDKTHKIDNVELKLKPVDFEDYPFPMGGIRLRLLRNLANWLNT